MSVRVIYLEDMAPSMIDGAVQPLRLLWKRSIFVIKTLTYKANDPSHEPIVREGNDEQIGREGVLFLSLNIVYPKMR